MEDLTGKQFGSYQIAAPLGEGGMAAVYKAYQPAMERFVAIKVLPRHMSTNEEFVARFRREAKLVAQLQHPHILPVFDYGESDGYPYIVMPFILSGTLATVLRNQSVTLAEARRIVSQIGDALSYAHARGMIHRDIKPSNILIDERGNCLLTDFGLARMTESVEKITTSGAIMGTPAYMSPEQGVGGKTDSRSDLYSLGIILYEMLTGRVPYTAETPIAVVFKHIQDPLPPARAFNPNLPDALELILLKSLAKNPDDRYQTADALVQAVQQAIPENPSVDQTLSRKVLPTLSLEEAGQASVQKLKPDKKSSKRRLPVWAFAGAGGLGLILIAAVVMMSWSNRPVAATPTSALASTTTSVLASSSAGTLPTATAQTQSRPGAGFQDEFDQQLEEGWTWLAEDPARWSLTEIPGWLQIVASDASFDGPSFPTNVLLRPAPSGDFEVTTRLQFTPTSNFQFAGLVVFQDKGNVLQFGRAFCDLAETCVGDGLYFDSFEDGFIQANHRTAISGSEVYLRLQRAGNTYAGFYSEDGENWTMVGQHTRDLAGVRLGLVAAQAAETISAAFDYFALTPLE